MPRRPSLTMPERAAPPPKPEPPKSYRAATRVGRRAVTFFLDEADYLELQLSSKRMNTTIQALGEGLLTAIMAWCDTLIGQHPGMAGSRDIGESPARCRRFM